MKCASLSAGTLAPSTPRCGKDPLNFTFGWIRTRLSGETLLRRYAPTSIFRSSGAISTFRQMLTTFHLGYHIFNLILKSYETLIPNLIGVGAPTFLPGSSPANAMLSLLKNGSRRSHGRRKSPG